jgi:O-antigen ligase
VEDHAMMALRQITWGSATIRRLASPVLERREFDACFLLSCSTMVFCLLLGGGTRSGFLSDALLQLSVIPLLIISLERLLSLSSSLDKNMKEVWSALLLCVTFILVPLVQLIPLPPGIWTLLPNRKPIEATFGLLGRGERWMPLSVSPNETWLCALSLLIPFSIFLGVIQLSYLQRRLLSIVALAVGIIGVFIGLAQVAQGRQSALRFFKFTNEMEAVGFFANRNHFAALIYALILFAAAWAIESSLKAGSWRQLKRLDAASALQLIGSFVILVVLLSSQAMTRSRAGVGLTIIALCGAILLAVADRRKVAGITPMKLILGSTALAVLFSAEFALYRFIDRFTTDPLADARVAFAHTTVAAAMAFMPFGSGIGTFVPVYAMFEQPKDAMIDTFVNHAHNDFLEAWLEAGIMGIVLMCAFAAWFIPKAIRVWRRPYAEALEIDHSLVRSATMIIALLALHSLVDYPLRTGAMMAIFAFCCALLIKPVSGAARERSAKDEISTDNETRGSARGKSRIAATLVSQGDEMTPKPPGSVNGRWGEDIDWPHEWRDGTRP